MNFEVVFAACLTAKKPYKSNPKESFAGIERSSYPDWQGWAIIDAAKTRSTFVFEIEKDPALHSLVREHYARFFIDLGLEDIEDSVLAFDLFEAAAMFGRRLAVQMLQKAVNVVTVDNERFYTVDVDGQMSPSLIRRVNAHLHVLTMHMGFRHLVAGRLFSTDPGFYADWLRFNYDND